MPNVARGSTPKAGPVLHSTSAAGIFTPEGYAAALEQFGDAINPAIRKALWSVSPVVRSIFVARFTARGVGRGIFGRRKSGAYKLVKTAVAQKGSVFVLALELRGFAALQEQGGRTKAHDILPKVKKALRLKVPSVGDVVRKGVHHPGSTIKADPSGPRTFEAASERIKAAIDNAIVQAGTGVGVRRSGVVKGAA